MNLIGYILRIFGKAFEKMGSQGRLWPLSDPYGVCLKILEIRARKDVSV